MSRSAFATLALLALLALTAATWTLAEGSGSPGLIAGVAAVKLAAIGAVFLELDRAWPAWALLAAALVAGVLGGAAWLIP